MLQTVKLNILIPLEYNKNDFEKTIESNRTISKGQAENCKASGNYNCAEWFHYCFRNRPIENNYQMANSPLVTDFNYQISRIELDSVARSLVGLHKNENVTYTLLKGGIVFEIWKIRIIFTKSRIAFLHIELVARDISNDDARVFISSFSQITSGRPQMKYNIKRSKYAEETISGSLKAVAIKIINLQSYIPLTFMENRTTPYFQVCMIGSCENEEKRMFFDSISSLSKRISSKPIDERRMYIGKEKYISRFIGDRSVCIYGDTETCGESNMPFITDLGNGLAKTATENYLTVYAFLISLQLLVNKNNLNDTDMEYLLNAPSRLSDEDNIREFFGKCLWEAGWNLKNSISLIRENLQRIHDKDTADEIGRLSIQMEEHDKKLAAASETLKGIEQKVDTLVKFVRTDLRSYIDGEKAKLNRNKDVGDKETGVSAFTQDVSAHIGGKISKSGDEIVNQEREGLELLFGEKWNYLMKTSQTSLVSAGVLLKRCSGINTPDFDFSGICICATAALEAELKRVFCEGFLTYMVVHYGEPGKDNTEDIYKYWPDELLTVTSRQYARGTNAKLKKIGHFTMGKLPYLFGAIGELSKNKEIRKYQELQSQLMKNRMNEYLLCIVEEAYKLNPIDAFYREEPSNTYIKCLNGCFVWKCEKIRNDYRNKAAHINVMSEQEAIGCYQSVVQRTETYVYNSEVTGVILELFSKVNGNRLGDFLSGTWR